MNRNILSALAAVMLGVTMMLFDHRSNLIAGSAAGAAAWVTILLVVAAARKDEHR